MTRTPRNEQVWSSILQGGSNIRDVRDFERSLRARNRSPKTIKNYRDSVRALAAFHGERSVTELRRADIETYLADG